MEGSFKRLKMEPNHVSLHATFTGSEPTDADKSAWKPRLVPEFSSTHDGRWWPTAEKVHERSYLPRQLEVTQVTGTERVTHPNLLVSLTLTQQTVHLLFVSICYVLQDTHTQHVHTPTDMMRTWS